MAWKLFTPEKLLNERAFEFAKVVLKDKTVVVADDNGGILTWLKFTLEDYEVRVFVFKHGRETLDFLKQERDAGRTVDVLILDLIMNEIGGLEIALFSKKVMPNATVLFLTGCNEESREFGDAAKIATVVSKPVGIEKMLDIIMRELRQDLDGEYARFVENYLPVENHASTCKVP